MATIPFSNDTLLKNGIELSNQSSTPSAPASGIIRLYSKTDNNTYIENSSAVESLLMTPTNTAILTNKTLDTAGSGNVLKINGTQVSAVTGTGSVVLATSPVLTTPNIGSATGNITGNAGSATNIASGAANSIPYQTAFGTTAFLAQGTGVLQETAGAPSFTTTPAISGANLTTNTVSNTALAQSVSNTWKGNNTGSTGNITDNSNANFTETGSSIFTISGTNSVLNAATIKANLSSTNIYVGNGSNVPVGVAMSGDVNISNTGATTIQNNVVSNAKIAQMPANTLKGNNTGSTANALDLTVTQVNNLTLRTKQITQTAHGFSITNNVPLPAYVDSSGVYILAISTNSSTVRTVFIISIVDANTFIIQTSGILSATSHGLTVGSEYYTSTTSAGSLTSTMPASGYSDPCVMVLDANTLSLQDSTPINVSTSVQFYTGDYKNSAQAANHGSWLLCDGTAISRTTYSALFSLVSTAFGAGDGSTTFNLPDARSSVIGGIGQRSGLTNRAIGAFVGEENHTLTIAEMPAHTHDITANATNGGAGTTAIYSSTAAASYTNTVNIQSKGGGGSHNNMQPTLFTGNYFIHI